MVNSFMHKRDLSQQLEPIGKQGCGCEGYRPKKGTLPPVPPNGIESHPEKNPDEMTMVHFGRG
jgi:hypothetical protein